MHIYFSGIGGVGLGPLAEIAHDAGFTVSGSDTNSSLMTTQLKEKSIKVVLEQNKKSIEAIHEKQPIDWFVYTAALPETHPELTFARDSRIKISKRDEFLAFLLKQKNLPMLAIAGTHGKTTTTAMLVWIFTELNIPISYSIGSQINFGPSGKYTPNSRFFVYECDEFDRNFLNFYPEYSIITSYDYDHPDVYKTQRDYQDAFQQFTRQSRHTLAYEGDAREIGHIPHLSIVHPARTSTALIKLAGEHNRRNGLLAVKSLLELDIADEKTLLEHIASFPGTRRRFEKLGNGLFTDYAHHPVEIAATLQLARELSPHVTIVYQPHQNMRQHDIMREYRNCFKGADKVYWLPTYLSREDPRKKTLSAEELASIIEDTPTEVCSMDDSLWNTIEDSRKHGIVVVMGAGDIDQWIRERLA